MKNLPEISSYGEYSNDNYGAHTLMVDLDSIRLYYSYKTIVAYYDIQDGLVCCENVWKTTTGKHLNWIESGHKSRIEYHKFQEMLSNALIRHIQ
jgi:hypothetical protein